MQSHIKCRYETRNIDTSESFTQCEFEGCYRPGTEKHHILCSFRWPRKHNPDWSDIINLCKHHHDVVHSCNNDTMRDLLLNRVAFILKYWIWHL